MWGNGFEISDRVIESDEALFRASMRDFRAMANRLKLSLSSQRLNRYRIEVGTRQDNPERDK